jgi:hypothetical protein
MAMKVVVLAGTERTNECEYCETMNGKDEDGVDY